MLRRTTIEVAQFTWGFFYDLKPQEWRDAGMRQLFRCDWHTNLAADTVSFRSFALLNLAR